MNREPNRSLILPWYTVLRFIVDPLLYIVNFCSFNPRSPIAECKLLPVTFAPFLNKCHTTDLCLINLGSKIPVVVSSKLDKVNMLHYSFCFWRHQMLKWHPENSEWILWAEMSYTLSWSTARTHCRRGSQKEFLTQF